MGDKTLSEYWHELDTILEKKKDSEFGAFPTSLKSLDSVIRLDRGQVMVIGGGPGSGKTSLALQMAYHISDKPENEVLFISLEMTGAELVGRMYCNAMHVNNRLLRTGECAEPEMENKSKSNLFSKNISGNSMQIIDDRGYKWDQIEEIITSNYESKKPDIIFLDFLQLIDWVDANNQNAVIVGFIRQLTELAKKYQIAIVLLSQLRRQPSGGDVKRPTMHDLLGSGSIEQCAHIILIMYRETKQSGESLHHILVEKNRLGEANQDFLVKFDGAHYSFKDLEDCVEKPPERQYAPKHDAASIDEVKEYFGGTYHDNYDD